MRLAGYRLLARIGAGDEGATYRALRERDGANVDARLLKRDELGPDRFAEITRRLRLARWVEHPAVLPIADLCLDDDPPFVIVEVGQRVIWREWFASRPLLSFDLALGVISRLVGALAAMHRVGFHHGRLNPGAILCADDGQPFVDLAGFLRAREPALTERELDRGFVAPEASDESIGDQAPADIYALGALGQWLVTGQMPAPRESSSNGAESLARTRPGIFPLESEASSILDRLVHELLDPDPARRPTALEVLRRFEASGPGPVEGRASPAVSAGLAATAIIAPEVASAQDSAVSVIESFAPPKKLGRFEVLERAGEGGMGTVYRGLDPLDDGIVALKTLKREWSRRPDAVRRFRREARLLARVRNPFVANLLEVNEDEGVHFLAMEFVAGKSLQEHLDLHGVLDEGLALRVTGDVARALADAHRLGIVHRDVKPDNILLVEEASRPISATPPADSPDLSVGPVSNLSAPNSIAETNVFTLGPESPSSIAPAPVSEEQTPRVKLTDFGLARQVIESESLHLTQAGSILGTPLYMAPEQATGRDEVGPPADVYSLGATLFHLLSGRPPFEGDSPLVVITKHAQETPPTLSRLNPKISDATSALVARCLAKSPVSRFADAGELLVELDRLSRGEASPLALHPLLPSANDARVMSWDFVWELKSSPDRLWPHVSNTERLNRAVGLSAPKFVAEPRESGGARRFASFKAAGQQIAWEEHPFEWIEGQRMGVLREFTKGPLKWFASIVELQPRDGGGTLLTHRLRVEPLNLLGRAIAGLQMGRNARRNLDRVYRRIDAQLLGELAEGKLADPFERAPELPPAKRELLERRLAKLAERGTPAAIVEALGEYLAEASDQDVARLRPLALARALSLDGEQFTAACLRAAREGVLTMLWDLLCPICRVPSEVKETLKSLGSHGSCPACNLDFELDFAQSVELIFRVHPEIRAAELNTYCVGGPAHSPHVAAQVRLAAGERVDLETRLGPGSYRLRGPQLPFVFDFRVGAEEIPTRLELSLGQGPTRETPRRFRSRGQRLVLTNDHPFEVLARVERVAPRDDALTAARVSSLALFRELFPGEALAPGQLVSVATLTFLVTEWRQGASLYERWGDSRAFAILHEHFLALEDAVRQAGGALVKTVAEGILAVFHQGAAAVGAALSFSRALAARPATRDVRVVTALHRGPAMAATLNDQLDYFGATVGKTWRMLGAGQDGDLVLSSGLADDPEIAAILQSSGHTGALLEWTGLAGSAETLHVFRATEGANAFGA